MSNLWVQAMGWRNDSDPGEGHAIPVREAGFAGYTQVMFGHPYDDHGSPEEAPDRQSTTLGHLVEDSTADYWREHAPIQDVDISHGVHATQSHVHTGHLDRHDADQTTPADDDLVSRSPLFATHRGLLHVLDGHHKVAAALRRGDKSIKGRHLNLDEHPFECHSGCEYYS